MAFNSGVAFSVFLPFPVIKEMLVKPIMPSKHKPNSGKQKKMTRLYPQQSKPLVPHRPLQLATVTCLKTALPKSPLIFTGPEAQK